MKSKNSWIGWTLAFGGVLLLTQIHLLIDFSALPWLLGFPKWLWFMMGVHALFVFLLYRFTISTDDD